MTETFKFRWKKGLFWKTRKIIGFKSEVSIDRMMIFFADGSFREIAQWSKCDCRLDKDFFDMQHKKMEQEAGQAVPVKVAV